VPELEPGHEHASAHLWRRWLAVGRSLAL
jgi:hypothetical protein